MIKISKETISDLLYSDSKPILEIRIEYPQIEGHLSKEAEKNFNSYYASKARMLNFRARTEYYRQALEDYRYSKKNSFPFNLHSLFQTFEETLLNNEVASLYLDVYTYTGGAHGMTTRTADTWALRQARRISLGELFPRNTNYTKCIITQVQKQIKEEKEDIYFDDAPALAEKYFDPKNFYLTEEGLNVFYQLYTIAPYYIGIKSFLIDTRLCEIPRPRGNAKFV